jgi:hypothetical protein
MEHVKLNLGNVLFIGLTASVFIIASMAAINRLSRSDVPVLSPTARGGVDFITRTVAA